MDLLWIIPVAFGVYGRSGIDAELNKKQSNKQTKQSNEQIVYNHGMPSIPKQGTV